MENFLTENTSMFISHGFALHVTWGNDGRGVDQFGTVWEKQGGYAVDENNIYKFKIFDAEIAEIFKKNRLQNRITKK